MGYRSVVMVIRLNLITNIFMEKIINMPRTPQISTKTETSKNMRLKEFSPQLMPLLF